MQINNNKNLRPKKIVSVLFKLSSVMRDENGKIEAVTYVDENGNYLHLSAEVRNPEFIEVKFDESYIKSRRNSEIKNSSIVEIKPLNTEVIQEVTVEAEEEINYSIPTLVSMETEEIEAQAEPIAPKDTTNWKAGARKREEARQALRSELENALRRNNVLEGRLNELNEQLLETAKNYIKHRNEAEEARRILNGEVDGMDVVVYKNNRS